MDNHEWQADVSRGWVLGLIQEYRQIQAEVPALRPLQLPNLCISDALTATLGQWQRQRRQLTLAARLFQHCDWTEVTATLRHEMAHQAVSELFGNPNEPPHGPAFRRACELLGIPPQPTTACSPRDLPTRSRLTTRIRKLLALGESPNPHEAERALAKAHELALRYNIGQAGHDDRTDDYGFRMVGPLYRRIPSYVWAVAGIVADFYFVLYISRVYQDPDSAAAAPRRLRIMELYGTRTNLDMAVYVYSFLLHQANAQWQRYSRENNLRGVRYRLSFLNGMFAGFRAGLETQRQQLADRKALIWLGDPSLESFFRQRNPRVATTTLRNRFDKGTHEAGRQVGGRLRLRPPLGSADQSARSQPQRLPAATG